MIDEELIVARASLEYAARGLLISAEVRGPGEFGPEIADIRDALESLKAIEKDRHDALIAALGGAK